MTRASLPRPKRCPERDAANVKRQRNSNDRKENKKWHACLCTTTESSRTPTPR